MKIKKIKKTNHGFALVYTLLFIVLLLVAVSATWFTGMADLRLSQKSNYSVQAYELAQAGIDDAFVKYKQIIGNADTIPQAVYPDPAGAVDACTAVNPIVHRTVYNSDGTTTQTDPRLQVGVNLAVNGAYDYRICSSQPSQIEAIGYYQGSKVTLKATITHDTDANERTCDSSVPPVCTRNHDNDYMTISQVGPSQ